MVIVEVSTDEGITGWGDAFAYVCPRTTLSAVNEMIAPQARGLEIKGAASIPKSWSRSSATCICSAATASPCSRFRVSILRCGISSRAKEGVPVHQLIGKAKRKQIPAYASLMRIGTPELVAGECETALRLGYKAIKLHETTAPAGVCRAQGDRGGYPADGRHELSADGRGSDRIRARLPRRRAAVSRRAGVAAGGFCDAGRSSQQGRARCCRRRKCLHGLSIQPDDAGRRGQPRAAFGDQGRRHHRISEGGRAGRRIRRADDAAFAVFRAGIAGDAAIAGAARRRKLRRDVLHEACRLPVERRRQCRRRWQCRSAHGTRARLRAGPGRDGAIPGVK